MIKQLLEIVKGYKFALAWENANCKDYVTEKLTRVFMAGVLPIVDGPDDYSPFVPNNHSVIRVADFDGPKALAHFLKQLEQDDERYLKYFEYKPPKSRYDEAFLKHYAPQPEADQCQLCRRVAEKLRSGASFDKRLQVDSTCKRRQWDREYYPNGMMSSWLTERWIEEWGFGSEDLVLWAAGFGVVALIGLIAGLLLRRRKLAQRVRA